MKSFRNPIILCDYSDPDVIRVDDTFYMTASSFNFTPGLPILVSKNLVDWTLVNYAAENIPLEKYNAPCNAEGIWAPSIHYHNGKFYIITGLPDEGIFITETENPLGKWSDLRCIWNGRGYIDPCILWDDDGKVYIVHAYAKSRIGFNSKIGLLEADPKTLECSRDDTFIFDGTKTQKTIEGPKIYRRDGYYYIFAPAGGVSEGWQTVLRSRNIFGPYEEKIVLEKGNSEINGPHQGALIDTPSGENWFIHFQDRGIYGRITHLEPVIWKNGWPLIGTAVNTGIIPGQPVSKYRMPDVKAASEILMPADDCVRAFKGADLNWQWSANHTDCFAEACDEKSFYLNVLNINSSAPASSALWNTSNVLTRKIQKETFRFSCTMDVTELPYKGIAGIIFLGNEYGSLAVERTRTGLDLLYFEGYDAKMTDYERLEKEVKRLRIPDLGKNEIVKFKLEFFPLGPYEGFVTFKFSAGRFLKKLKWHSDCYNTDNAHWVGGRFGVYAVGSKKGKILVTVNDKYC